MKPHEISLIDQLHRQDPSSIDLLVNTHAPAVFSIIMQHVKCRESAEAVCDDVFTSFLDRLDQLNS